MLRLLIIRFWPALVPILLYAAWVCYARRKAAKAGEAPPAFFDGPWIWAVTVSLLLCIGGFIMLGLTQEGLGEGHYVPAKLVGGKIVPGHVEPER
jgi:hypothetical protein